MRAALFVVLCPFLCTPASAQASQPAQELLRKMSLEEKAGYLQMVWTYSKEAGQQKTRENLKQLVRDRVVGGIVLSLGHRDEAGRLIQILQKEARYPLLIAGDFETGVAFRLTGTTNLGSAMLLGATGLSRLAQDAGRITAVEGRALGFHVSFSPVLDVNNNPKNPIINVRSFGEDPNAVARLGIAYIQGMQGHGLAAVGKHFPGHGDVDADSHLVMPTVHGDRKRLDSVELVPFQKAIEAGLKGIMTGHLAVPGFGEKPGVPATLSPKIMTGVLRKELGFAGFLVTDSLGMGGITKIVKDQDEAALVALEAGSDLLLMPRNPRRSRDRIVAAVKSGRIKESRLDQSVLRLLRLIPKKQVAATAQATWSKPHASSLAVADEIAARGVTLVKDDAGLVPLADQAKGVVILNLHDKAGDEGRVFAKQIGLSVDAAVHDLHPETAAARFKAAVKAATEARTLVVAMHVKVRAFTGKIGLPAVYDDLVEVLQAHPRSIVVSFGNPYLIQGFPKVSTYLCAYCSTVHVERAAARVLAGRAGAGGRLPIRIPGVASRGDGISARKDCTLSKTRPEHEGVKSDIDDQLRSFLSKAIADKVFPGAVCRVTRRGRVVAEVVVGKQTWDGGAKKVDDHYDMASLTKVSATLPAVLKLIANGKLSLDDKVQKHLPGFLGENKDRVTVRHLMAHCSGLPGYIKYFLQMKGKDKILAATLAEPLEYQPGTKMIYSDLGLITLMAVVEKVSGERFEDYVRGIHRELDMTTARFVPTGKPIDAVPTEDCPWRGKVMKGEVHDENTFAMGGVSGHAGLFATVSDISKLAELFLAGNSTDFPRPLLRLATKPVGMPEGSRRALLWATYRDGSFGHTGFTGTSVRCWPRYDLCVILLSNRVHPSRKHGRRSIMQVRSDLAKLVVGALEDRDLASK